MSRSEANLIPAKSSVAIEDVYGNNDEMADTNREILIPNKININNDDTFNKSMQKNSRKSLKRKKKISTNLKTLATKIVTQIQQATMISYINGFIQERLSRKGRAIKLYDFRGATVNDIVVIRTERFYVENRLILELSTLLGARNLNKY